MVFRTALQTWVYQHLLYVMKLYEWYIELCYLAQATYLILRGSVEPVGLKLQRCSRSKCVAWDMKVQKLCTVILAFTVSPMIHEELFLWESDIKRTSESVHCHVVVFCFNLVSCRINSSLVGCFKRGFGLRGSSCWLALQSPEPPAVLLPDSICSVSEPEGSFYNHYTFYNMRSDRLLFTIGHALRHLLLYMWCICLYTD